MLTLLERKGEEGHRSQLGGLGPRLSESSLRSIGAPIVSGRIFHSSLENGVKAGVPLGPCCVLALAQGGAV